MQKPYWQLLLILQVYSPSKAWVILLVILGGAWLLSYLWALSLQKHLSLTPYIRTDLAQVGDIIRENYELVNAGLAPALWVEILTESNIPGTNTSRVKSLQHDSRMLWEVDRYCSRRGLYTIGPVVMHAVEPVGIFAVTRVFPNVTTLLVLPPVVDLPGIEIVPGGRVGEGNKLRANAFERSVSSSSVRIYQPGDALKHIHWATSARRNQLYVRMIESTPASDWWIFLDLNKQVQVGEGWDSTEEHGIILAASLAVRGLTHGHPVGLVASGASFTWLPPKGGVSQQMALLRLLALIQQGTTSIADLLRSARPSLGTGASLIIITADANPGWLESLIPMLKKGITPTVFLLDPPSFGGNTPLDGVQSNLTRLNITHYKITRDVLNQPQFNTQWGGKRNLRKGHDSAARVDIPIW
jgi:uncharacterized protein (DUF58 family)